MDFNFAKNSFFNISASFLIRQVSFCSPEFILQSRFSRSLKYVSSRSGVLFRAPERGTNWSRRGFLTVARFPTPRSFLSIWTDRRMSYFLIENWPKYILLDLPAGRGRPWLSFPPTSTPYPSVDATRARALRPTISTTSHDRFVPSPISFQWETSPRK